MLSTADRSDERDGKNSGKLSARVFVVCLDAPRGESRDVFGPSRTDEGIAARKSVLFWNCDTSGEKDTWSDFWRTFLGCPTKTSPKEFVFVRLWGETNWSVFARPCLFKMDKHIKCI